MSNQKTNLNKRKFDIHYKLIAVLLFFFAILLTFSLVSFTSSDEAAIRQFELPDIIALIGGDKFLTAKAATVHNWLGVTGAYLSNFLYNKTFGFSTILFPFFILIWAYFAYSGKKISKRVIKYTSLYFSYLLIVSSFVGGLQSTESFTTIPKEWSGAGGKLIADLFSNIFGLTGALVVFFVIFFLIFTITTNFKNDTLLKALYINILKISAIIFKTSYSFFKSGKLFKPIADYFPDKKDSDEEDEEVDLPKTPDLNEVQPVPNVIALESVQQTESENISVPENKPIEEAPKNIPPVQRKPIQPVINKPRFSYGEDAVFAGSGRDFSQSDKQPHIEQIENPSLSQTQLKISINRVQSSEIKEDKFNETTKSNLNPIIPVVPVEEKRVEVITPIQSTGIKEENFNELNKPNLIPKVPVVQVEEKRVDVIGVKPSEFKEIVNPEPDDEFIDVDTLNQIISAPISKSLRTDLISPNEKNDEEFVNTPVIKSGQAADKIGLKPENSKLLPVLANFDDEKSLLITIKNEIEEPLLDSLIGTAIHDENINFLPPGIGLLSQTSVQNTINEAELNANGQILQEKLETFKIVIENLSITPGPVVTQYEFVPAAGIKISKIESLADDLAMALKARGIRIIAPIPGKGTVGVEIPNANPQTVSFFECISSSKFINSRQSLPVALGKTISGEVYVLDIAKMPHLLIAGSTGSGKSVGINTIITSLVYKLHPSELKFVIIDPKKVELQQYSALKHHFLAQSPDVKDFIVTKPEDAVSILKSVVAEMELRYDILASVGQRNINDYNERVRLGRFNSAGDMKHRPMPYIVVIIDELADLMLTASKEIEEPITRLAQMARAVGIHLVVATQRPSVDVITGLIKANFPARIAYLVTSKIDSRTILDMQGAEQLLGRGDLLCLPPGEAKPVRIQNAFISTEEVENICDWIGNQKGYSEPYYLPSILEKSDLKSGIDPSDRDPLFEEAARLIIRSQQGSVSQIQRRLKVGYARAGRIVDELEAAGVVGPYDGSRARIVLMESESDLEHVL